MATSVSDVAEYVGLTRERIKQIARDAGLPISRDPNGYVRLPAESVRRIHALRNNQFRPTVATIGLQKGGVGKSLLTINTALAGAQKGARVLVIDLDPEACATQFLVKPELDMTKARTILDVIKDDVALNQVIVPSRFDGISIVPCRNLSRRVDSLVVNENPATLLAEKIIGLRGQAYDLILFDVPPSFNNLIASAYLCSEIVICPVNSDVWSLESLQLTTEDVAHAAKKWRCQAPAIRVVRNRVAPPQRRDTRETEVELAKAYAPLLLDIAFKASTILSNAINDGVSIFEVRGGADLRSSFLQLFDYLCPLEHVEAAADKQETAKKESNRSGAINKTVATPKKASQRKSVREVQVK